MEPSLADLPPSSSLRPHEVLLKCLFVAVPGVTDGIMFREVPLTACGGCCEGGRDLADSLRSGNPSPRTALSRLDVLPFSSSFCGAVTPFRAGKEPGEEKEAL